MDEVIVRPASVEENEAIGNLLIQSFTDSYQEKTPQFSMNPNRAQELRNVQTERQDAIVLAAYQGETLAGTVSLFYPDHPNTRSWIPQYADLRYMGVASPFKKKGVSQLLINAAINHSKSKMFAGICLHARQEAIGVAELYKKHGFIRDESGDFSPYTGLYLHGYKLKLT